ncbi:MAG: anion permease [Bacteroidia bacterium]|nr:MAG: anion permease [Bacteroidia bacterium]
MFTNFQFLFLLFALIAEIIGTVGGFGSSVFFVPIANFYFDFQTVLGITAVFHLSSNISKIALFRKGLDKKLLLHIGLPSVFFVIIGAIVSKYFSTKYLEIALGIFLISLSLLFLIYEKLAIKQGKKESIIGGSLSGFIAGLLGTGGAIRGLTMAAFNLEKSVFVATSAFIDFGVDFTRTIIYFFNGYIKQETLIYLPFLLIIGFLGSYIGRYILTFISQENFKKISLLLIFIIGLMTIVKVNF